MRPSFLRTLERARPLLGIGPMGSVVLVGTALSLGHFRMAGRARWVEAVVGVLLVAGVGRAASSWLKRRASGGVRGWREDFELGATLLGVAFVAVAAGGEAFFPLVYLLMAFLVSFMPRRVGLALVGVGLGLDGASTVGGAGPGLSGFLSHAAYLSLFAALYHVVLSARLAVARKAEEDAVKRRLKEVEERARTFRLVAAGTKDAPAGVEEQEKWLLASVKEIEGAVGAALEIAEIALKTDTCAVFLLSSDDRWLKLHDCRSTSERVQREKFPAGEGILGGVLKRKVPVRMASPTGLKGITYYEGGGLPIGALLAIPILEASGQVRGVLVADRHANQEFTEADERLFFTIAGEVLRAIEVERVLNYIRKGRDEKDAFFRAIEELNRAGNPDQVFVAVLESARQLAGIDFCAVTLVSEENGQRTHRIARMTGMTAAGRALEGHSFADNTGLVANVVRYGTPLPGRDVRAMDRQVIFDSNIMVRGLAALKIFPLQAGDRILGTLVAGSRKKAVLDPDVLRMIEVVAIQAAHAVLRAQLFEQMEKMATTDGLTGLVNQRSFQGRADEALAQARRYGRKCSVIITDIDHFKSVNDTYGHAAGDVVLRDVARIIRQKARDTDIVARYGGEEFALVMPETDTPGAQVIAERIREAVKAETFRSELGPIKVTLSLGIATFPEHGKEKQAVMELADQCLYHAKRTGRDRSVSVAQMAGAQKLKVVQASGA